jgi:hypothetical protein
MYRSNTYNKIKRKSYSKRRNSKYILAKRGGIRMS